AEDRLQRRDVRGEPQTIALCRRAVIFEGMDLVYACPAAVPWLDQRGLTEGRAHVAPVCPERRQEAGVRERIRLEVQPELEHAEFGPRPDLVVQVIVAGPEFADPRQVQRAVRTEPSGRVRACR